MPFLLAVYDSNIHFHEFREIVKKKSVAIESLNINFILISLDLDFNEIILKSFFKFNSTALYWIIHIKKLIFSKIWLFFQHIYYYAHLISNDIDIE